MAIEPFDWLHPLYDVFFSFSMPYASLFVFPILLKKTPGKVRIGLGQMVYSIIPDPSKRRR